tara:strand:- start:12646 stop:13026 length:381 start_codon:yes stop_codon:yes gene_type:complete
MKETLAELKKLAEDSIEFAKSIKQPSGHTSLCNLISVYMNGSDYSVTFTPNDIASYIEVTLYSGRVSVPVGTSEVDLQEAFVRCRTSLLEFKESDLAEKIRVNSLFAVDRIEKLKKELELLENTNQ